MSCCWCGSSAIPSADLFSPYGSSQWCSHCIQTLSRPQGPPQHTGPLEEGDHVGIPALLDPLPETTRPNYTTEELLAAYGLSEDAAMLYAPAFDVQGYDSESSLRFLTGHILTGLGVLREDHRLRLLRVALDFQTHHEMMSAPSPPLLVCTIEITGKFDYGIDRAEFFRQTELFGFSFKDKILGPNGENIEHMEKTGAHVSLQGIGSNDGSDDPLHILIESTSQVQLQSAFQLAKDLLASIDDDWSSWENGNEAYKTWLGRFWSEHARA
jgi:hypothetical protein